MTDEMMQNVVFVAITTAFEDARRTAMSDTVALVQKCVEADSIETAAKVIETLRALQTCGDVFWQGVPVDEASRERLQTVLAGDRDMIELLAASVRGIVAQRCARVNDSVPGCDAG